ncbi:galanin receptor type 2-like [Acanthaster planci]|uniref:Galanin receptor type 2-like n=1 Tax=Acanthaster planci TaxID=133434 RepID=A0A8B7XGU5_ACAPL|nr:galanin receptor type 2-like [Acanthaster planci]
MTTADNQNVFLPGSGFWALTTAINMIIVCLTLLGNGTVIVVMIARRQKFSSSTNRLILHQSIIDAISGLIFFFLRIVKSSNLHVSERSNFLDQLVCRCFDKDTLLWWAYGASTYNFVFISLERFLATCYPVKHRNMVKKQKLRIAIGIAWAIGFFFALPMVFKSKPIGGRCQHVNFIGAMQTLLDLLSIMINYLIPLGVPFFAYVKIFVKLKKGRDHSRTNCGPDRRSRAKKNVLITMLVTSILFVICWTPRSCGVIIRILTRGSGTAFSKTVYRVMTMLVASNMFVNPIVYCLMYKHFRDQLKDLLLKRLRRNQVHSEQDAMTAASQ